SCPSTCRSPCRPRRPPRASAPSRRPWRCRTTRASRTRRWWPTCSRTPRSTCGCCSCPEGRPSCGPRSGAEHVLGAAPRERGARSGDEVELGLAPAQVGDARVTERDDLLGGELDALAVPLGQAGLDE